MKGDFTSIPNLCITHFDRQKKRGLTTKKVETPTPTKNSMSRIVAADETKRSIQPVIPELVPAANKRIH